MQGTGKSQVQLRSWACKLCSAWTKKGSLDWSNGQAKSALNIGIVPIQQVMWRPWWKLKTEFYCPMSGQLDLHFFSGPAGPDR